MYFFHKAVAKVVKLPKLVKGTLQVSQSPASLAYFCNEFDLLIKAPTKARLYFQSGQTHDTCAVPAILLQRKIQTNAERFILTAKLNAVSENLSFLR